MITDADKFIQVIRDHKDILLQSKNTQFLPVSDIQLEKFRNNFFGLIKDYGLSSTFNHAYLIMNDLDEATQTFELEHFIAPSETDMVDLYKKS